MNLFFFAYVSMQSTRVNMLRLITKVSGFQRNSSTLTRLTIPICDRIQNNLTRRNQSTQHVKICKTHGHVCTSPYAPITIPDATLDKYVWKNLKRWQNKTAAVCVVTGRKYTFGQLRDASASFAINLQKIFNLQTHDVISISIPNLPEYPIVVLGALEAGLATSLMNPIYDADEIARQLNLCNTKLIVCTPLNYEEIKKACKIAKRDIPIICIPFLPEQTHPNGSVNFFEIIRDANSGHIQSTNVKPEDLAILPFSSGTTGLAKGVMLTHRNIVSNCEMFQSKLPNETYVQETTDTHQDVIPCFLPFFHIFGLTVCLFSKLHLGCKLVTFPRFTSQDLMSSFVDHKGSIVNLAPPILLMLINSDQFDREHLKSLRIVTTGAAPIGLSDVERFFKKFSNVELTQGYGLTETSPCVSLTPIGNKKFASIGLLASNTEVKIIPYDGSDLKGLGVNKSGEICVRGPQVMKGYLHNEEANSQIFLPDDWLRTGDIAHYDDEGYFFITDRIKELIKVKGFQVPPAELEEVLRSHPNILDAAVFGISDPRSGEAPRAVVVPKPNVNVTEKEIFDFVAEKVVPYKKLSGGVLFVKEIPKNASGKILRRELKEKYGPK